MEPEDWPRFMALLDDLLELPQAGRGRRLAELAKSDPGLQAQLAEWLQSDTRAAGFLEAPLAPGASWQRAVPVAHGVGETIGGYRILRLIGVGGSSLVFEAEQAEPQRSVALKVFQSAHGARARERFVEEAEILASLCHPGIAQVFAAGSEGAGDAGRPWIAMELVQKARSVTRYAREEGLTRQARLALFRELAEAVAHGHERGVIHRDLKPANLLVDSQGQPKVIDFGVARATRSAAARGAPALGHIAGLLGTLPWMSPERLRGRGAWPDTRADVYALGIVLFELLTDALPHALEGRSLEQILRLLDNAPPLQVPGADPDLEAILQVATARAPEARYASAAEFVADLDRFSAQQPVTARRASLWNVLRLALRRHRNGVLFAGLAALLVITALALGLSRAARVEARERSRANEVTQFLKSILALASPSTGARDDLTMREVLDDASERIERELADAPGARAEIHALVGSAWRELGQLERAEKHLRAAAEILRERDPGSPELAGALSILSEVLLAAERGAEAEQVLQEAKTLYAADPDTPEFFLGIVTNKLAGAKRLQGELEEAEGLAGDALDIYRRAFGEEHLAVASALDNLAVIQRDAGRLGAAIDSAREALKVHLASSGEGSLFVAQARIALARLLLAQIQGASRVHVAPPQTVQGTVPALQIPARTEACALLRAAEPVLGDLLPEGHAERIALQALLAEESCRGGARTPRIEKN